MKKRWFILILIVTVLLVVPAQATTSRIMQLTPTLTFDGTTANCAFTVSGNTPMDDISIVLKLWRGNTCLATWEDSGIGYVHMSETETVAKGYLYQLTADVTINGKDQPQVSVSARCS